MSEPIFYRDLGAGPPLVLVHGGFNDGPMAWSRQMESLADRYRLIVVDRRGQGQSPKEPKPYTIAGDAVDVLEAADRTGLETFHLAGHSSGGMVAIEVARRTPERLRSLHLIEPPYLALRGNGDGALPEMKERLRGRSSEEIATEFFSSQFGAESVERMRASGRWPAIVREAERFIDTESPGNYPKEVLGELQLNGPVAVYCGGRSSSALQDIARRMAEGLPNARLFEIPEATHGVQHIGAEFDRYLVAVIDEVESESAD